ncbi:MAG: recombinase RecA [Nitrososphaerota archaeon]|nr:recombinase RecA [Nitrososphaerota archaeon]
MIRTGLEKLDEILGDSLRSGTITDVFGESGAGKTQLVMQIIANSVLENNVFYQDTTGNFRPERLLEMTPSRDPKLLDKITVSRITNVKEQQDSLDKIKKPDFSLIVIDSVTDLFSFEYPKEEQFLEKTTQFSKYMKRLSQIAFETKIPIIITNMMRKVEQTEQENMESIISLYTHIKIKLAKKQASYEGQVFLNPIQKNQFSYVITKQGLSNPS